MGSAFDICSGRLETGGDDLAAFESANSLSQNEWVFEIDRCLALCQYECYDCSCCLSDCTTAADCGDVDGDNYCCSSSCCSRSADTCFVDTELFVAAAE